MSVEDYLKMTREHFSSYHNQKEQMAYGVIVLSMAGLAAMLAQSQPIWATGTTGRIASAIMVLAIGLAAARFMYSQLDNRRYAANMVRACDEVINDLLAGKPAQSGPALETVSHEPKPTRWDKPTSKRMPAFLRDKMREIEADDAWQEPLKELEYNSGFLITAIIVAAEGVVIFLPIFKACGG